MALITLDQAKVQIRVPLDSVDYDDDLLVKIEHATAIVVDYLDRNEDDWVAGSPQGSPTDQEFPIVQAAILEVLANLWRNRGDEAAAGPMTSRVEQMLRGLRIPALG